MNKTIAFPSPADIEAAYLHARWLRSQTVSGESRMLADLSYEVQRLRSQHDDDQAIKTMLRQDNDRLALANKADMPSGR
jgi:hypothetical protein